MSAPIRETGTMTSKGQTTVPKSVRQTLGLAPGDRLSYTIRDGVVTLAKAESEADHADPAIAAFLDLLARDIADGRNLGDLPRDLAAALTSAAAAEVDPDEPIDGDTVL